MEDKSITVEYIEANHGRLERILTAIESLNEQAPYPVVINEVGDGVYALESGAHTAESITEDYEEKTGQEISEEEAGKLAAAQNRTLLWNAAININQALVVLGFHAGEVLEAQAAESEDDDVPSDEAPVLGYEEATWRRIMFGDENMEVRIYTVAIRPTQAFELFQSIQVIVTDGEVQEHLTLSRGDGAIYQASYRVESVSDPLVKRGRQLMQDNMYQLLPVLKGYFGTEDMLAEGLDRINQQYQGTALEEEVGAFLGEVREKAIAAKEGSQLTVQHGLNLPAIDVLEKFIRLLEF